MLLATLYNLIAKDTTIYAIKYQAGSQLEASTLLTSIHDAGRYLDASWEEK